ncbi:MAG: transporter substrate-binding domain-containing protein [Clostridia bacterium]|nr:transporter substrate-binding domain-containing protein [Clostridia bacterium]
MKKIITLLLCIAMLCSACVGLTSCFGAKDVLTVGVTPIPGMNEKDANGEYTVGFESEFAMAVADILGMEVEFQEISWEQKYNELNSGAIDCVWNNFTANCYDSDAGKDRKDLVDFSYGYMLNQQCIVVKTANLAQYTSEASLAGKTACVEAGSAGAAYAETVTDANKITPATVQLDAFTEVKAGAVDFIVVDIVLAQNVCGKGNYTDLSIVEAIELDSEIYAVGFKKGSELTAKVNDAIKQLYENGKLMEIAEKWGCENRIKLSETID